MEFGAGAGGGRVEIKSVVLIVLVILRFGVAFERLV